MLEPKGASETISYHGVILHGTKSRPQTFNAILSLWLPVSQLFTGRTKNLKSAPRNTCPDPQTVFGFRFEKTSEYSSFAPRLCKKFKIFSFTCSIRPTVFFLFVCFKLVHALLFLPRFIETLY